MEVNFSSKNPLTNVVYEVFEFEKEKLIETKLEAADMAFQIWRTWSFEQRAERFYALERLLLEKKEKYAQLISEEMGKPVQQAIAEIEKSATVCRYYAEKAASFLIDQPVDATFPSGSFVSYEPLGAILQIMPWNFPFWQVFRCTAPTLMAGNTTLLKPANNVPRCALAITKLFKEAGFPKAVFQTTFAKIDNIETILKHPAIQGVALTGSDRAGAAVGALAGKYIKPALLELGGSDPFIVLEDADIEKAAAMAIQSRFNNNGQTCIAAKRFIVHQGVKTAFVKALKKGIADLKKGDAFSPNVTFTGLARPDLVETLNQQVQCSVKLGATIELAGGPTGEGTHFAPIIITNLQRGMPAYEEELFGPVIALYEVASIAEAITLANDTIYGLGAAIWTKKLDEAKKLARELTVGTIAINGLVRSTLHIPFGGVKRSGIGRELGREGILAFVNMKSVII